MKKIILSLTLLITIQNLVAQANEKDFYIIFNSLSKDKYNFEIGNGKKGIEKIYIKEIKKNGDINFYIQKELFVYQSKIKNIDSCTVELLKNIKISNIKDLKEEVKRKNPLYPYRVFPNLFLVDKINDSIIVKYKVKWEYYIE